MNTNKVVINWRNVAQVRLRHKFAFIIRPIEHRRKFVFIIRVGLFSSSVKFALRIQPLNYKEFIKTS